MFAQIFIKIHHFYRRKKRLNYFLYKNFKKNLLMQKYFSHEIMKVEILHIKRFENLKY